MTHYYNEHNAYRAAVLRERMAEGLLPKGVVDERDIETIPDEDFLGYTQIHLFAGIGGFPLGLQLAGFPEHRRIVTGGFPCQDISNAGKRAGITGSRSRLWREMVRCVRVVRPELVFVENVAALLGRGMGVVLGDLAEIGYDAAGDCISAADVGAPHLRRRIWIVAHSNESRPSSEWDSGAAWGDGAACPSSDELSDASIWGARTIPARSRTERDGASDVDGNREDVADAEQRRRRESARDSDSTSRTLFAPEREESASGIGSSCQDLADSHRGRFESGEGGETQRSVSIPNQGSDAEWDIRWPVEPDVGRVAHGIPKRVDRIAALGDAIVPQCAAEAVRRLVFLNRTS